MLVNYMTIHIKSVKLSRDFVVIQHFRFCKLFSKHVSRCFLHRYTMGCTEKRHIYIQVNQKLLYRESDWWDVGLVVQKARKQGTVC